MKLISSNTDDDLCKYHTGHSEQFWHGYNQAIAHFDDFESDLKPEDWKYTDSEKGYMERIYEIVSKKKEAGKW